MQEITERDQRKLLEQNGRIPLDVLGEGGGARVFKVLSMHARNRLSELLIGGHDRERAEKDGQALAQAIIEFADGTQPVIAAAKVAKHPDSRTKSEIQILTKVQHPHLIRTIAIDSSSEPQWYVMPVMKSGSLEQHVSSHKGQLSKVMRGVVQITGALAALHEHGIVHRDVKPANIFVADNGDWILGDPGVAYKPDADEKTTTRAVSKDWFPRWFDDKFGQSPQADLYISLAGAPLLALRAPLASPASRAAIKNPMHSVSRAGLARARRDVVTLRG